MKILTLNFLTCARKACKPFPDAFPLHPKDVELEIVGTDFNLLFLRNILPRLEWGALKTLCNELGLPGLKDECPEEGELFLGGDESQEKVGAMGDVEMGDEKVLKRDEAATGEEGSQATQLAKDLHRLLMETNIQEGKLVCGHCRHEYAVKEGIANFLLPSHLV